MHIVMDASRMLNSSIMLKFTTRGTLLIFFKYLFQHQQNKCVYVLLSHSVTLKKIHQNILWICWKSVFLWHQAWIMHSIFFSYKIIEVLHCSFPIPIPHIPCSCSFFLSFWAIEVLSSCPALDSPLSFIHDILITKSVINTLLDQYFPSIMADRCGLMWHKELDKLLSANSGAASARESNGEADWWRIPQWRSCFQRIIKQLVLFVTVTTHLSSINC